tara:strand:- start:50 stop:391 length:342 start_codon:yes stop_codon:yes gene_type:complete
VEIKFYGAFALNRRVDLHAIDATPRWRGGVPVPHRSTVPARPRHSAPDTMVDFHTGNDALHDRVLTRDVHNLLPRLHNGLFHAFAGPAPVQRLAGGLRLEYSLELINLSFIFS